MKHNYRVYVFITKGKSIDTLWVNVVAKSEKQAKKKALHEVQSQGYNLLFASITGLEHRPLTLDLDEQP